MRSTGFRHDAAGVSLFPFLAVLLCTMGALIVLLVVLARQVRSQQEAAQASDASPVDLSVDIQRAQWRVAQLDEARRSTLADLAEVRAELSHVENHMQRLEDELAELGASGADLDNQQGLRRRESAASERELQDLDRELADAETRLDEARRRANRTIYAVVPYGGPRGTERLPLLIECRRDRVVLQPEGVVLRPQDFQEPLGPGNPLASAVRAAGEHLRRGALDDKPAPYPLLLVRPDGVMSYYAARAALSSWNEDFGYEMVDADWELAMQPADDVLASVEQAAIQRARQRQRLLAIAAPSRYRGAARRRDFTSPPTGDFHSFGGAEPNREGQVGRGGLWDNLPDDGERPSTSRPGRGTTPRSAVLEAVGKASSSPSLGSGQRGEGGEASADGPVDDLTTTATQSPPGAATSPVAATPSAAAGAGKTSASSATAAGAPSRRAEETEADSFAAFDERRGPEGDARTPSSGDPQSGESLAAARGRNGAWGRRGGGAFPLVRPVRVTFEPNRLTILPDNGSGRPPRTIEIDQGIERAADQFVASIREQVESWGIAGRGMYWRPVVWVDVAGGAAERFADLQAILADSGLELVDRAAGPPTSSTRPAMERR